MKFLKEPLFHFLLIGAALFAVFRGLNPPADEQPNQIIVSDGQIQTMVATFTRTWQRPPTTDELKGLVDDYVQQEMLAREAIKLSLEQNDPIIRRRLQQKMDFIVGDIGSSVAPSEAELQMYLEENPDTFRRPAFYSLTQVYLSADKRGESIDADAAALLETLHKDDSEFAEMGDPTLLPRQLENSSSLRIASTFGSTFAASLDALPLENWSDPIVSAYGLHIVRLSARTPGYVPELAEIRAEVEREWADEIRRETRQQYLDSLLTQYNVTIEWPEADSKS